jgi:hypothetical protein
MRQLVLFLILCLCFTGCKQKTAYYDSGKTSDMRGDISTNESATKDVKADKMPSEKDTKETVTRQLIKTGSISYNVNDLGGIEEKVESKVKETGGYVFSTSSSLNSLVIQVKIPQDRFDEFVGISGSFGKIDSKHVNVEDVTMQYYDLDNRIKNKKILQDRLRNYLSSSHNIEDLLKVESELNRVTEELESIEGQFNNLSHMISYSSLTMNFYVPGSNETVRILPSLSNSMKDLGYALGSFFIILSVIILGIIGFGIPIIVIIALLYFVTFGKIGLVRKLFRFFSGNK